MNKIYLFLVTLTILTGCTSKNHESSEPEDKGTENITLNNEELKILKLQREQNMSLQASEVIEQAVSAMSFLQNGEITKGKKDAIRTIGRISALTTHKTKTERTRSTDELSIDTLAYVVNFANGMGYAIVAADKRVDLPILAFCPEGDSIYERMTIQAWLYSLKWLRMVGRVNQTIRRDQRFNNGITNRKRCYPQANFQIV